jgi:hypothetical protein
MEVSLQKKNFEKAPLGDAPALDGEYAATVTEK